MDSATPLTGKRVLLVGSVTGERLTAVNMSVHVRKTPLSIFVILYGLVYHIGVLVGLLSRIWRSDEEDKILEAMPEDHCVLESSF